MGGPAPGILPRRCIRHLPTCPWEFDVTSHATTPLVVDVNPYVFASSSIFVTFAPEFHPAERFVSVSTFNSNWTNSYFGDESDTRIYEDILSGGGFFDQIAVKATLAPIGAATGLAPTTLYKSYDVLTNEQLSFSGFGGCGGGGFGFLRTAPSSSSLRRLAMAGGPAAPGRSLGEQARTRESARPKPTPASLEDYVTDYLGLLLERDLDGSRDPAALLAGVRDDYRAHLAEVGAPELSEREIGLLQAVALRAVALDRQARRRGESLSLDDLLSLLF